MIFDFSQSVGDPMVEIGRLGLIEFCGKDRFDSFGELEKEVHQLELKTKQIEQKLSTPEGAADPTLYQSHLDIQQLIVSTMTKWEQATIELEEMNDNE